MDGPEAPPAPDYGAATREGIEAGVENLPLQLLAEAAAREGRTLYRRADGSYTLDAPGGEPADGERLRASYQQYVNESGEDNPRSFEQWLSDHVGAEPGDSGAGAYLDYVRNNGATEYADFTGVGRQAQLEQDLDYNRSLLEGGADIARGLERGRLEDMLDLLPQYNELNLAQQRAAYDAALEAAGTGEQQRLDMIVDNQPRLTQAELDSQRSAIEQGIELLPGINEASLTAQRGAYEAGNTAWAEANPELAGARGDLVAQLRAGVSDDGELTPAQRTRVEQNMRKAQAARGNVLGDAPGFAEALAVSGYGEDLQRANRGELAGFLGQEQGRMPSFQAATAPALSGGSYTPVIPNFQATTTSGPNTSPAPVQTANPWQFVNPNAGAQGAQHALNVWDTQYQAAQQQQSPWASMLGLGLKTAGVAGGLGWRPFGG